MYCYKDAERKCNAMCMAFTQTQSNGTNCTELANRYALASNTAELSRGISMINELVKQGMNLAMSAVIKK